MGQRPGSDTQDLERYSGPNHLGASNSSPYPTQRLSASISLVDTAREIERASASVAHQTNAQLRLIAEQMQYLEQQARRIVEKAEADLRLHQAHCNFTKVPGHVYHLYDHPSYGCYLSLLSPADYRDQPPYPYLGSYRLQPDNTWTDVANASSNADGSLDSVVTRSDRMWRSNT